MVSFTDTAAPCTQLIRDTIDNFNIDPDKHAVTRIGESLSTLQQSRELRMRDMLASLHKLSRQLNTLTSQHAQLTASSAAPSEHASHIATLDTAKFRTAKAASDAEMDAERLAQRAADLNARLQELQLQGVDAAAAATGGGPRRDAVDDEVLLRLKVYRSLGIEIERDDNNNSKDGGGSGSGSGTGEWTRAVVRNDRKADVHVVNMDKKFSRYFYANYFWQTL